jgi:hypothetical protein
MGHSSMDEQAIPANNSRARSIGNPSDRPVCEIGERRDRTGLAQ